jgi:membrane-bound serine protease (ClpP class)
MLLTAGIVGLFVLPTPWNVLAVTGAAVGEVLELVFWLRFLRRYRIQTGIEGMVGERGEVIERFSGGAGRVRVHGEIWTARSEAALEPGQRIRVSGVDGLTLEVGPES